MSLPARAQTAPRALDDTYYVLTNRQKYIDLRAIQEDESGTLMDPEFVWTIHQSPTRGILQHVHGSTYYYYPGFGLTGPDCFEFKAHAPNGTTSNVGTITIEVGDAFIKPFGLGQPEFGIEEDWDDYSRPPGQVYNINLSEGYTIPHTLHAGDVVQLTGESAPGGPLTITATGTCNKPIFIRGISLHSPGRPKLRHGLHIKGDYVIIEYIDFDASLSGPQNSIWVQVSEQGGGSPPEPIESMGMESQAAMAPLPPPFDLCPIAEEADSTHVAVRHCSFLDHPTGQQITTGQSGGVVAVLFGARHAGPNLTDNSTTGTSDCVAYDILVANFGDWQAPCTGTPGDPEDPLDCPTDYYGAGAEGNSVNTWVLDSVFHHIQGGGAGLSRSNALSQQRAARNGYIGRNVIHHVLEYGISLKMAVNAIVSQNDVYRIRQTPTASTGAAIHVGNNDHCNPNFNQSGDWYSDNVWVIFNHVYDVQTGRKYQPAGALQRGNRLLPERGSR